MFSEVVPWRVRVEFECAFGFPFGNIFPKFKQHCNKSLKPSIKKTRTRFRHEPPPMSSSRCASCLASPGARCINNFIHQNSIPWPWHGFTCSVVFSLTVAPLGLQRQSRKISEFMWWQVSTNLLGTVQHAHLTIARSWPSVNMFFDWEGPVGSRPYRSGFASTSFPQQSILF